ncbi:MAG: AAA family ATPase [Planctomycetaceae bacterium]
MSQFTIPHTSHETCHREDDDLRADEAVQEALARCDYLVSRRRPLGLVTGQPGVGRGRLLDMLLERLDEDMGCLIARFDATDLSRERLELELIHTLGLAGRPGSGTDRSIELRDRIEGLAECGRAVVVLIDHLDEANADTLQGLRVLLRTTAARPALTIIGTARPSIVDGLRQLASEFGFVRIELRNLTGDELVEHARDRLTRRGEATIALPSESEAALREITGGLPRDVERLCELLALARSIDDTNAITPERLRAAHAELI